MWWRAKAPGGEWTDSGLKEVGFLGAGRYYFLPLLPLSRAYRLTDAHAYLSETSSKAGRISISLYFRQGRGAGSCLRKPIWGYFRFSVG
jgi:hypothetical protein